MSEVILTPGSVKLVNHSNFESLIYQLYNFNPKILFCIRDGSELLLFHSLGKFPRDVTYEGNIDEMYFFRENKTESLYTIFGEEWYIKVQNFLNYKEKEVEVASIIRDTSDERESSRLPHDLINKAEIVEFELDI